MNLRPILLIIRVICKIKKKNVKIMKYMLYYSYIIFKLVLIPT